MVWKYIALALCLLLIVSVFTYAFIFPILDRSFVSVILDKFIDKIYKYFHSQNRTSTGEKPRDGGVLSHNIRSNSHECDNTDNQGDEHCKSKIIITHGKDSII